MFCVYVYRPVHVCKCLHVCHMYVYAQKGQKKESDPLEPKLQVGVSFLTWVLGNEI